MAEQLASKALIALKQKSITNLGERGEITVLLLMAVVVAALVSVEVWWFNQPTIPSKVDTAVDINTATVRELTALSGVDEPTANKIVDGRPYMNKDELVQKKIISQATYDKIEDEIVAKQQ
jgi:DNA uptake protein ComE-like DNA-binding protein